MEAVAIVTVLIVLQTFWFAFEVGSARGKFEIRAPHCTGDDNFDRAFRVHQNSVEQLVLVIPVLWIFAWYVHALAAAGIGVVFLVSRLIYRASYRRDPASRGLGFGLGALCFATLALGGLIGAAIDLLA